VRDKMVGGEERLEGEKRGPNSLGFFFQVHSCMCEQKKGEKKRREESTNKSVALGPRSLN
jgi:hypothetical protein